MENKAIKKKKSNTISIPYLELYEQKLEKHRENWYMYISLLRGLGTHLLTLKWSNVSSHLMLLKRFKF